MYICLTNYPTVMPNGHLRFELDNITAVAYVNHMAGSRSMACDTVCKEDLGLVHPQEMSISDCHILGFKYMMADSL